MQELGVDIETYSSNDLIKGGVYKYVEAEDFEILLFTYSVDSGPVEVVDLASGEALPLNILLALTDDDVTKTAFNANFERTCIAKHFKIECDPRQWSCTMVKAAMLGYPFSLEKVAEVMKLEQQKDSKGKALIRYFSLPCKPTKTNDQRTRNLPEHAPEKWNDYIEYCRQDVVTEQAIRNKISWFSVPEKETKVWELDQRINDRGVKIDRKMAESAIKLSGLNNEFLISEATQLTGLDNPNSAAQLKRWLSEALDEEVTGLKKTDIPDLLSKATDETTSRVLQIRQELAKTSVKKYTAMLKCICIDDRARGLIQYGGASRTLRFAGRLIQVQNLPRTNIKDVDTARRLLLEEDLDSMELIYGSPPDTLSQLIRTAIVADQGKKFTVYDFSSIELIVAAWLAREQWVIDEFNTTAKIYEQTASRMFNIPLTSITKDSDERQKGKIASLACQYGGSVGALMSMDTKKSLKEEELPGIVSMWRLANPNIVKYWADLENAAFAALEGRITIVYPGVAFGMEKNMLFMKLPSGRKLYYMGAHIIKNRFGNDAIGYYGMAQTTRLWTKLDTYGGKLFENLCQAVARDCLVESMLKLDAKGYDIVFHVHDEIVVENDATVNCMDDIKQIMTAPIPWAPGLPLKAEGFETQFYKK